MTCQNNRGLSCFLAQSEDPKYQWPKGSTSHSSQAPVGWEWCWDGEPAIVLATVVLSSLSASIVPEDRFRASRHSPCHVVSASQFGNTLTSSQPAVSSTAPCWGCLRNYATGHQCWAIKENCGSAAGCQGASHSPHKKGVPSGESGRQWAHSPEYQPFSWREWVQQFSLMLPQTADAKNTLWSRPSFLQHVAIHHL